MKTLRIIGIVILAVVGLNAIVAGVLFMADPSGAAMGLTDEYLKHAPFRTYLIPGLVLLLTQGVSAMVIIAYVLRRNTRSGLLVMVQGVLLCGWIVIQMIMVRDMNVLQVSMLLTGLLLVILGRMMHRPRNA